MTSNQEKDTAFEVLNNSLEERESKLMGGRGEKWLDYRRNHELLGLPKREAGNRC